jgi:hypothetical protein
MPSARNALSLATDQESNCRCRGDLFLARARISPAWARTCMNASCIDCRAQLASKFSTTVVSARTTSSTSSVVMWDDRRDGHALDRRPLRAKRRELAPNSTRHLAARDATSRKCRNSEPISGRSPLFKRRAAAVGKDPAMRRVSPAGVERYAWLPAN